MSDLFPALIKGVSAFCATNLDDIVILLLFFSQVGVALQRRHIVTGQYLGFAALVLASLPGFFSGVWFPQPWVGMLGIVPIAIGLSRLFNASSEEEAESVELPEAEASNWFTHLLSPQSASVAAITFANGGDNIGIYMPLFASTTGESLGVILSVFFTMVGVWCYTAYRLTRVPAIATALTHYGNLLIPFVLIGLGVLILVDSHTLEYRGLTALSLTILGLCVLHLMKVFEQGALVLSRLTLRKG